MNGTVLWGDKRTGRLPQSFRNGELQRDFSCIERLARKSEYLNILGVEDYNEWCPRDLNASADNLNILKVEDYNEWCPRDLNASADNLNILQVDNYKIGHPFIQGDINTREDFQTREPFVVIAYLISSSLRKHPV